MALVSKILETTLTAGSTAVTFTDADIPNSLIRVFSSNSDVIPESRILSGNTLTVTYAAQSSNMDVALEIVKQGLDIVDNVLSSDTDKALSAKQGYLLSAAIGDVSDGLSTLAETVNNLDIPDNISDLDDVNINNIQSGQVLAWDGTKFVNVSQSAASIHVYSTEEHVVGKWLNNEDVYEKTYINLNQAVSGSSWVEFSAIDLTGISQLVDCNIYRTSGSGDVIYNYIGIGISSNNKFQLIPVSTGAVTVSKVTISYVK